MIFFPRGRQFRDAASFCVTTGWRCAARHYRPVVSTGCTTVVFDSWEDTIYCSVVNVLMRVEGHTSNYRQTYFSKSVFTWTERIDGAACVTRIEGVMQKNGGTDLICAISSGSALCFVNERNGSMATFPK